MIVLFLLLITPWLLRTAGTPQDAELMRHLHQHTLDILASKPTNPETAHTLSTHFPTIAIPTDPQSAIATLGNLHEWDYSPASFSLASHLLFSPPRSPSKALAILQPLADKGYPEAQRMLGLMYATSIGTASRDYRKALLYQSFAALSNDSIAQIALGYYHHKSIAVAHSCEDSSYFYRLAAKVQMNLYKDSGVIGVKELPYSIPNLAKTVGGGVYGSVSGSGHPKQKKTTALTTADILDITIVEADKGDISSQYNVGNYYYHGSLDIPKDYKIALKYFKKCVKNKVTDNLDVNSKKAIAASYGFLGKIYSRGEGVDVDIDRATKYWSFGKSLNDSISIHCLGLLETDMKLQIEYFTKAAKLENPESLSKLGELILSSTSPDYSNAKKYFTSAEKLQDLSAFFNLGEMNYLGLGTEKKCDSAISYYKQVIESTRYNFDWMDKGYELYKKGDYEGSLIYFTFAAELGFDVAQLNAAWIIDSKKYATNNNIFGEDLDSVAMNLWNRAANQNHVDARIKVGDYFFFGGNRMMLDKIMRLIMGDEQKEEGDAEKAALYYQVAANTDHSALAMWNLGWMYENGVGVKQDYHLAKRLYDQSLATNPDAYLPVYLSLINLYLKSYLSVFTSKPFSLAVPEIKKIKEEIVNTENEELDDEEFEEEIIDTVVLGGLFFILVGLIVWRRNVPLPQAPLPPVQNLETPVVSMEPEIQMESLEGVNGEDKVSEDVEEIIRQEKEKEENEDL